MNKDSSHETLMKVALALAERGRGRVSPNPMVGAVVVKGNRIVGRGYHRAYGKAHAEVNALNEAGGQSKGGTLYVTLEPCISFGHTPPCVDSIINSGVRKVVVGSKDPNPEVNGRGVRLLRQFGVEVIGDVLSDECRELNEGYFNYMKTGRTFVIVKVAATLDGKIAAADGSSKWITGRKARSLVHGMRKRVDGVVVGVNTIIRDDPLLTSRGRPNPKRIIVDSSLRTPESARILRTIANAPVIIATTGKASRKKAERLAALGAQIVRLRTDSRGRVDLRSLLKTLPGEGVLSVIVEGGGEVFTSFLRNGLADKLCLFLSPMVLGGSGSLSWAGELGAGNLSDSMVLGKSGVRSIGRDFVIEGSFR